MYENVIMKYASITVFSLLIVLGACGTDSDNEAASNGTEPVEENSLSGELNVVGSTTVQPLAEVLTEAFEALEPDVIVFVQGGGSSVGVRSAVDGTADIGMASRDIKLSELQENPEIRVHTIARDGIAIIAEPGVTVDNLSKDQIRNIFSGEITNWNEVGGENLVITVVAREEGSGTRAAFEELVMDDDLILGNAILQPSNGAVRTSISVIPGAIGFLSFGYLDDQTKPLAVDGFLPTEEFAASGSYEIVRPLNMVTNGPPEGIAAVFLEFIVSEDGQAIVASEGYLPVN